MSGVERVPAEAVEAAVESIVREMRRRNPNALDTDRYSAARDYVAAALPLLREGIAAEVLGPVRELLAVWDEMAAHHGSPAARVNIGNHADSLRAALSAPVQAAGEES